MKKEKSKMSLFRGKKKFKASKDQWMYLLQNDLIDVLKVKKAAREKVVVEGIISKMLQTRPKLSQDQLNDLYNVTEQVVQNINLSEGEVEEHVSFMDDFTRTVIRNQDAKAIKENYFSTQRKKQNLSNINKEILVLKNLLNEQKEKKGALEEKLDSIKVYVSKHKVKLAKNPTELRNVRKAIERTELARKQADQQIGVLNTSSYGKETQLEILNQAEEARVIDSVGKVDVTELTSVKASSQDKLEQIVKDGESLESLNKMNEDQLIKTNPVEDSDFLSDWLGSEQEESVEQVEESSEKEENFEDFMKSLNK